MHPTRKAHTPRSLLSLLSLLALLAVAACADQPETAEEVPATMEEGEMMADTTATGGTIVDVVLDDDRFSTLALAIDSAGLDETLYGSGPFTVFAPTNEAFAALPAGTLDELLLPENREQLRNVLLHHVADGSVMAADVETMPTVTTLEGGDLSVSAEGDSVMVGEATVIEPNIEADNGVIHVIDAVLLPPE